MDYLVSAIVSTYNAERFIKGLLDDLLAQTIGKRLEIIIIDSGSPEYEGDIVREYQKNHSNIKYERTERETVYAAWNRGIKMASGKYITNANTDDRHRVDAYEVMANYLDEHPEYALVYSDTLVTYKENETFEANSAKAIFKLPEYDHSELIGGYCYIGPMPMWRKSIHDNIGYFDPEFVTSGDYDFWLKASEMYNFKKINQTLGIYVKRNDSVEHSNKEARLIEDSIIKYKYRSANNNYAKNWSLNKTKEVLENIEFCSSLQKNGNLDECIRKCDEFLLDVPLDSDFIYLKATSYYRKNQFTIAVKLFEQILDTNPTHSLTLNNLAVWYWASGEKTKAINLMNRCCESDPKNVNARVNLADMYLKVGKPDLAAKWHKEVLYINPSNRESIEALRDYYKKKDTILSTYYADLLTF
jgi:glycosyltransferase involved in cell wall biosynthesis